MVDVENGTTQNVFPNLFIETHYVHFSISYTQSVLQKFSQKSMNHNNNYSSMQSVTALFCLDNSGPE